MAERKQRAAPLEWAAAAVGLLIFAGLFATIFAEGLKRDAAAVPDLAIESGRTVLAPGGTLVEFAVRNRSARTAAAGVVIEGEAAVGGGGPQKSQVTIDYVPGRSSVTAGLLFRGDVRGQKVEIRPVGYRLP